MPPLLVVNMNRRCSVCVSLSSEDLPTFNTLEQQLCHYMILPWVAMSTLAVIRVLSTSHTIHVMFADYRNRREVEEVYLSFMRESLLAFSQLKKCNVSPYIYSGCICFVLPLHITRYYPPNQEV